MGELILYFDGRCTGNGTPYAQAGYGWVLICDSEEIASGKGMAGEGEGVTVITAEYAGLLAGLRALLDRREELGAVDAVEIRGDNQTVIRQVTGAHGCWAPHLQPLHREAHALAERLQETSGCVVTMRWIPSGENARADELSRAAFEERERARADGDGYAGGGDPVATPLLLAER